MMKTVHRWRAPHGKAKNPAMLLPKQLRAARILAGMSRPQLAKKAGAEVAACPCRD